MRFLVARHGSHPLRDSVADGIISACLSHGHELSSGADGVQFVLNLTDVHAPRPYRRRSQSVLVVSIVVAESYGDGFRALCYTTLIRALSNLLMCVVPQNGTSNGSHVYFTTPEAGFYHLPFEPEQVYRRISPIIGAHFATENRFSADLPPRYFETSEVVEQIKHYGKELDSLGVLPTPFPLRDLLCESDLRHLHKIFGITGASYGNLSAREQIPELGETTFWMTGRGVDKANISGIGRDVFLVKGFDHEEGAALVSVPPDYDPTARVSVDAVEHELIYRTFPDVDCIVHAHAWMHDILCTRQNYPCGTRELAEEVIELLHQADDPTRTAVGLKNHGLTITGHDLDELFTRIRGRLLTEVAMFP